MKPITLLSLVSLGLSGSLSAADHDQRIGYLEREVSELRQKIRDLNSKVSTVSQSSQRSAPTTSSSTSGYRVKSGDTFWGIAKANRISVSSLERANPSVNPSRLRIGTAISIPGSSNQAAATSTPSYSGPTSTYAIRSGDTLGEVAEDHGISLRDLMAANRNLNPLRLQLGQKIKIPGTQRQVAESKPAPTPAPTPQYRVATRTSSPSYEQPPARTSFASAPRPPSGRQLVTVSQNRRLDDIARYYGTDVPTINRLNQVSLSPAQIIKAGSQLHVPQQ
ncbi:LysM peptidoglycan-binding domain-containing protein [Akkermansiaceae bacterium]|nr:LysM peptidoglycan-binding domain-containing protein [Akkermansiaceae bacterium]